MSQRKRGPHSSQSSRTGYDSSSGPGQKRLMYESVGLPFVSGIIDTTTPGDYGADPLGNGTFRMVPSGDIVDYDERCRRRSARRGTPLSPHT